MRARKVYGIDLGTTYSCIAQVDEHGKPVILNNAENESTTPSVVFFETETNVVVGKPAKEVAAIFPDRCVTAVKRAMGDAHWEREFFGETYRPQDVSALILKRLAEDAEKITGEPVEDVVITCPAYFGINEKEATKQAGEIAGLNVLHVIPEPTAAALAYGVDQKEDQVVLVYDLGGGTFDVTLIDIKAEELRVICTGGDHQLGGKNWDETIVEHLAHEFEAQTSIPADSLTDDQETYQELLNAAEDAKKALSSRQSVTIPVRFEGERVAVEITRERFDELTASYLERTLSLTQQEIEKARSKSYERIDKLLLVGGSTYMPQVKNAVEERFRIDVLQFDPNQAVAKGAAVFGHKCALEQEIKIRLAEETGRSADEVDASTVDPEVIDRVQEEVARNHGMTLGGLKETVERRVVNVTSRSFGVQAYNNDDRLTVAQLIRVNSVVPASVTQKFGTHEEGQVRVDLECMESRADSTEAEVDECEAVGSAVLSFGQALPKDSPVEVRFDLAADGLLTVYGKDLTTGKDVNAEFQTGAVMTREEIERSKERAGRLRMAS